MAQHSWRNTPFEPVVATSKKSYVLRVCMLPCKTSCACDMLLISLIMSCVSCFGMYMFTIMLHVLVPVLLPVLVPVVLPVMYVLLPVLCNCFGMYMFYHYVRSVSIISIFVFSI